MYPFNTTNFMMAANKDMFEDEGLLNPVLTIDERIDGKWLRDWMALIGLDERVFFLDVRE